MSTDKPSGAHLSSLLDVLWKQANPLQMVEWLVTQLTDSDWLILTGWDFAVTFCPALTGLDISSSGRVQVTVEPADGLFLVGSVVTSGPAPGNYCLHYEGTGIYVSVDPASPTYPRGQFVRDPKGLLLALELIRDHLDSTLVLPPNLREARLRDWAELCGLEPNHFRKLSTWFPRIEQYLK